MGVLDITSRSVRLGNLGAVQSARTDTGAIEAANRIADASRRSHQARAAATEAYGQSQRQLGDAISRLGGTIVDIAAKMKEEETQRRADEYAARFQEAMVLHNQGDGKENPGAMNATIPDTDHGEWMDQNHKAAESIHAGVLKDMGLTDKEFKGTRMQKWRDQYLLKEEVQWLTKDSAAKAGYRKRNADAVYKGALTDVTSPIVSEDAWDKLDKAVARKIAVDGMGEEEAAMFRRRTAETVWGSGIKQKLDETMGEALAAGADGGKVWEKLEKGWKDGLTPESLMPRESTFALKDDDGNVVRGKDGKPKMRSPLKEWTNGSDFASIKKAALEDLATYKAKWKTAYDAAVAKKNKEIVDDANRSIIGIYTSKKKDGSPVLPPLDETDPHSVEAHYSTLSRALETIGTNPELVTADPAMAKGLVKSAHAMAQKGRNDAQKLVDQRVEQVFLDDYDDPTQLGWMAEDGFHKMKFRGVCPHFGSNNSHHSKPESAARRRVGRRGVGGLVCLLFFLLLLLFTPHGAGRVPAWCG